MRCPIPRDEREYLPRFQMDAMRMLELGNKRNEHGTYKAWFESIGIQHTSVDWNGQDGALPLDLRRPLGLGQFDMVTNIGTTEHVSDQAAVWNNIHQACRPYGYIVSITPMPGDWWWHGEWYPWPAFFSLFADLNGYRILKQGIGRQHPNRNVCVLLWKNEHRDEFTMPPEHYLYRNPVRPRNSPPKQSPEAP